MRTTACNPSPRVDRALAADLAALCALDRAAFGVRAWPEPLWSAELVRDYGRITVARQTGSIADAAACADATAAGAGAPRRQAHGDGGTEDAGLEGGGATRGEVEGGSVARLRRDAGVGVGESAVLAAIATWRYDGELHVLRVATDPRVRRAGLARALLAEALADARVHGVTRALLEVGGDNPAAIALYEGFGFRTVRVRRGYYRDPLEDALAMELDLRGR